METTFMTIHSLSPDANILFASESIVDILGYNPDEVTGRSCFDYFHPDEVPFARNVHQKGVQLDKAAALYYARIKGRGGQWIGCECVFTIVHDVLVACTSIYKGNEKNEQRALHAPAIRRIFASSPRDPRYHMLEHLSAKFRTSPQAAPREPRAALILNRFTRTLTVMYATNAVSSILGVTPDQLKDKSFYECIQENCLPEAIRCLESAKANDSIAYLRFVYRDPRRPEDLDEEMHEASQSSDSEDGGVELHSRMDLDSSPVAAAEGRTSGPSGQEISGDEHVIHTSASPETHQNNSRTSSGESTDLEHDSSNAIFDREQASRSSTSSLLLVSPDQRRRVRAAERPAARPAVPPAEPFEIEAVVSCTSDGLVVVLRRARPMIPNLQQSVAPPMFAHGLFAAPWGANPIRPHVFQPDPRFPVQHGLEAPPIPAGGPPQDELMTSIREIAVFAWSLAGINGNIASYGRGVPTGESQPPGGLPIWDPHAQPTPGFLPPENQAAQKWAELGEMTNGPGNDHKVPYRHPRQDTNLRYQNGYGMGATGSDQPGSSAHDHLGSVGDVAYNAPPIYDDQYNILHGQIQGQQGRVVGVPPVGDGNNAPTTQDEGPSAPIEGSRGNRYLWY